MEDNWKHRSNEMRCQTCMWFAEKESSAVQHATPEVNGRGPIGRCRRHAPRMAGFPVVFAGDWCGDHKLNEEKIQ